jgi:hypothetical protein
MTTEEMLSFRLVQSSAFQGERISRGPCQPTGAEFPAHRQQNEFGTIPLDRLRSGPIEYPPRVPWIFFCYVVVVRVSCV